MGGGKRAGPSRPGEDGASPAERFARDVEGLDADAIERANREDGAPPGGVPPGWGERGFDAWQAKRSADKGVPPPASALDGAPRRAPEWARAGKDPGKVVALGSAMAGAGIRDKGIYELDRGATPAAGDIVAGELEGVGAVLRRLDVIGGAQVLAAEDPEVLAIPIDHDNAFRCHGVVRRPKAR